MGGGVGFWPAGWAAASGAVRGSSFEPVVTPAPELSAGGAAGVAFSSLELELELELESGLGAAGLALGGGMGRVAEGASGMSSGFCCAAATPASNTQSNKDRASLSTTQIFVDIPAILYLSFSSALALVV
jgi:hypothetical protein